MNYLAHILLSGDEAGVQLGGFIADSVKGRKYNEYPEALRFGILLHRKIDSFTDAHPEVLKSIFGLRSVYGKYSGVVVDMLYDHFLAVAWAKYSNQGLRAFSDNFYNVLKLNVSYLPERFKKYMPVFIEKDRLNSYTVLSDFEVILRKMGEHTSLPAKSEAGMEIIHSRYELFKSEFSAFFPDLRTFTAELMKFRTSPPKVILAFGT
ncbi:MAG: ACP phosphodiesterase [Bacteroidota bacterium]|nr:ACP phosphodiesterase [Bacteroidota bacterium]